IARDSGTTFLNWGLFQGHFPENINLDMDTTHPSLNVMTFSGVKSVSCGALRQKYSKNAKRFMKCLYVLGLTGFTSGRHYWEVEVKNKTEWFLGVINESANRNGDLTQTPEDGVWQIKFSSGTLISVDHEEELAFSPYRVGIFLDYEDGLISFYSADDMTSLFQYYTVFTEKLYPLFCPGNNNSGKNSEPLRLHP
uniref:B30.2/SPRY domain-containing protein n=1 Tax=Latimeria chalumnae TaxID=7897 RepID=H3A330_LATCH